MRNNFNKRNSFSFWGGSGPRITFYVLLIIVLTCFHIPLSNAQSLPSLSEKSDNADNLELPDERVFMKTDRELYLCGEKIYFSAFTCEENWFIPVSFSSVLYVEFYDHDNRVLIKGKFALDMGRGSGFISIPKTITTDYYYIRAYTNYMKNFGPRQFFVQRLKIVNPFTFTNIGSPVRIDSSTLKSQEDSKISSSPGMPEEIQTGRGIIGRQPEHFILKLTTDKIKYKNREEVKVFIAASDDNGKPVSADLTLQVSLSDSSVTDNNPYFELGLESQPLIRAKLKYYPEIHGDIISGRLLYKDEQPAAGVEILQSFTGRSSWVESCVTDRNGNFYFDTGKEKNSGDLIFKVQNSERETSVIQDEEFFSEFMPPHNDHFKLTSDEIDLVAKYFINIQVEDAFSGEKKSATLNEDLPPAFYGKEYTEYRLSEYAKLPNMKEFIFEVIKGLVLGRESRQEVINIIDEISFRKIGANPLMLIDGVPLSESSTVLGLNPEKISVIRVVRDRYYYKNQAFDGILDIITLDGNAKLFDLPRNTFRFNFVHPEKTDMSGRPDLPVSGDERIPSYNNLLFWNARLKTDENGRATVSFATPDNSGNFIIKCYGFSVEGLEGKSSVQIVAGENKLK